MADKTYRLNFELSDGSTKSVQFVAPQGEQGIQGIQGEQGPQGIQGVKGDTGSPAGFGNVTATVDNNIGTPSVTVTTSGEDTAKNFSFAFHNLKGESGSGGGLYIHHLTIGNDTSVADSSKLLYINILNAYSGSMVNQGISGTLYEGSGDGDETYYSDVNNQTTYDVFAVHFYDDLTTTRILIYNNGNISVVEDDFYIVADRVTALV